MNLPLLEYFVLTLGLVYLITEAAIFAPVRVAFAANVVPALGNAIYCRACVGFWVGFSCACVSPFHTSHLGMLLSGLLIMLIGYVWTVWSSNQAWYSEQILPLPTPSGQLRGIRADAIGETEPENDE